jgi:hypothetical protein
MKSGKVRTNIYFEPELKALTEEYCDSIGVSLTRFCEASVRFIVEELMKKKKACKGKKK